MKKQTLALMCSFLARVTAAVPAFGATPDEAACRKALAAGVRKLVSTVMREQARCHEARMQSGSLAASKTDCNDQGQLPQKSRLKIDKLEAKLDRFAQARCADTGVTPSAIGFDVCDVPCETITIAGFTGQSSVASCLSCRAESEAAIAIEAAYGTFPDPPLVGAGSLEIACQKAAHKALLRHTLTRMNEQHTCQYLKDLDNPPAGIGSCCDARPSCSAALNGSGSARYFVRCNP